MAFSKGHTPWNKGIKTGFVPRSAFQKGFTPWNKGTRGLMPIPWMKGKHHTGEAKEKNRLAHLGKIGELSPSWKGGKPKCLVCGILLSSYGNKYCYKHVPRDYRKIGLKGAKELYKRKPTSIEIIVYQKLKDMGFIFETQKIINGKFVVDAYIPSLNLIIEADGDYWHSLERIRKKDKAENAYLTKCGFELLRLSEREIRSGKFIERLVN